MLARAAAVMPRRLEPVLLLSRYGLVGAMNTVISLSIITGLDLGLHAPPAFANAVGYAVGVAIGFGLNHHFVFRSRQKARTSGPRYLAAVVAGFTFNQIVLQAALRTLGPGALPHEAAQLAGMAAYTTSVFLACRFWVFRARSAASLV